MPMCLCTKYSACNILLVLIWVSLVPVDPPEKLQQTCPTCPLLLPAESQQAVSAAHITLTSYKRQSTLGAGLGVKKITRAAAQVRLNMQSLTLIGKTKLWMVSLYNNVSNIVKHNFIGKLQLRKKKCVYWLDGTVHHSCSTITIMIQVWQVAKENWRLHFFTSLSGQAFVSGANEKLNGLFGGKSSIAHLCIIHLQIFSSSKTKIIALTLQ